MINGHDLKTIVPIGKHFHTESYLSDHGCSLIPTMELNLLMMQLFDLGVAVGDGIFHKHNKKQM